MRLTLSLRRARTSRPNAVSRPAAAAAGMARGLAIRYGAASVSSSYETKGTGETGKNALMNQWLTASGLGRGWTAGHPPFTSHAPGACPPIYCRLEKWEGVRGNPFFAAAACGIGGAP